MDARREPARAPNKLVNHSDDVQHEENFIKGKLPGGCRAQCEGLHLPG
jgi:hypothetical protein